MTPRPAKAPTDHPAPGPEYDEFEGLAKKLVRVPKKEVEEERAKANGKKPKPAR